MKEQIMEYTFGWCSRYGNDTSSVSRERFPTISKAIHAANEWLKVNYENDYPIMVWIVAIHPDTNEEITTTFR